MRSKHHAMARKFSKRGGAREGAGRTPKDPEAGNRVPFNARVRPDTLSKIQAHATPELSQGEIVDEAVAQWRPKK
jgi:hypothetical protein